MTAPHEPPHDLDAEKAVLGSILLDRDAITTIAARLTPEMFYLERHAVIYRTMAALYNRRTPPDIRLVAGELRSAGQLDECGGILYLSDLSDTVPTASHIEHYAGLVEKHAAHRAAIALGSKIAARGYDTSKSADELRADVQGMVNQAMAANDASGLTHISTVLERVINHAASAKRGGTPTGLYDYDTLTGGLWPGHLVVPAGRPGHGKSSFVGTVASNIVRRGLGVLYFTLEMEEDEVVQRLVSSATGINGMEIRQGDLSDDELRLMVERTAPMTDWPLFFQDVRSSVTDIRAKVLRHIAEHGPVALVVIDYIQLIPTGAKRSGTRQQEIGEITRALKSLAKEAKCTVMAPSQLSREIERRDNPLPVLSDLREAGDIENDADQVVFVVRPELFEPDNASLKGTAHLYVAKHRGGRIGKVELGFDAARTTFTNIDKFRTPTGY